MNLRREIQTAVIRTNRIWPLSYLNRAAYRFAIRAFLHSVKQFPEIKSVYLRHGLLNENWVPGISDIDLTVVFDPQKTLESEFKFVSRFWEEYERLQKYFPMLGEADLISHELFSCWARFGIRGFETSEWRLLHGSEIRNAERHLASDYVWFASFHHALLYFSNFFLPALYTSDNSKVGSLRIRRLYSKILRYIFYEDGGGKTEIPSGNSGMLHGLLRAFEERLESFPPGFSDNRRMRFQSLPPYTAECPDDLKPFTSLIETCYLSMYNNIVILFQPEIDDFFLASIRRWQQTLTDKPILVTHRLFRYLIRFYDPFLYSHLAHGRCLVYGIDLFPEIEPPNGESMVRTILDQVPLALTFYTRRFWITTANFNWFTERQAESFLERGLMILLLLQDRILLGSYAEYRHQMLNAYPEYYELFHKLSSQQPLPSLQQVRFEFFRLFRRIALQINEQLLQRFGSSVSIADLLAGTAAYSDANSASNQNRLD